MGNALEANATGLVALAGMTQAQFEEQTDELGEQFEPLPEDAVPGFVVMRGDYDNAFRAIAADVPELARLTNANASVAQALLFVANAGRLYTRFRAITPSRLHVEVSGIGSAELRLRMSDG